MKTNVIESCQKKSFLLRRVRDLKLKSRSIANYFKEDREKLIILIMIVIFPINLNLYMMVPDFFVPYYESFQTLVFTISESIGHLILSIALYYSFNKKDKYLQYLPFAIMLLSFYQIGAKLFSVATPGWLEVLSFALVIMPLLFLIWHIKNKVIADKLHKANHGILQNVCRIEGLAQIIMEDKDLQIALMGSEATKLKAIVRKDCEKFNMEEVE